MHGAAKVPHWNRDRLALMFGRKPESVQLFEGHVGGGFGIRGEMYPEDVLVCAAALAFKKPIKWIEDRREHLMAANHSRQQRHKIRAAIDGEGLILGIDDEFFHDNGAYTRTHAATVPDLAAAMLPGPYRVPAYRATGHMRLTNKTPCGTYRSPGRYETTFVRERLIDAIAAKTGLDAIEVRRRNFIAKSAMPYERGFDTLGTHVIYDCGDYAGLMDKLLAAADWPAMRRETARRRANGEKAGCGFAMFVEKSGLGPFDKVRIEVSARGAIEVVTGVASVGQGVETAMAQIAAETLGVDYAGIKVTHGQTDRIDKGLGAFASSVTVMCGEATRMAAAKLREDALAAAAALMQCEPEALDIVDGEIVRSDRPGPSMSLAALAAAQGGLRAEAEFKSSHMVYPYGAHVVQLAIDAETGGVTIERYLVGLRHRQGGQPDAGGGPDHGRHGARLRRRALRGISLQRGRRAAVGDLRRLSDADRARSAGRAGDGDRGRALPAQFAGGEGRRRRRHHAGGRGDRLGHRRRAREAGRGDAIAGDAAAAEGADGRGLTPIYAILRSLSEAQARH